MKASISLILLLTASLLTAQNPVSPTSGADRLEALEELSSKVNASPLAAMQWQDIGPTVFSGRVTDIEVNPDDPSHFYVAYASGGLWYTQNNGTSFMPLFDHEAVMTIGDIAVDWERQIIYVGTGENNSSRSSYSGVGIYKSVDNGKTWTHMGLEDSQHIGRILLHPSDPDVLWVASLGPLYSQAGQRGIFKTVDGGTTWNQTLVIDEATGVVDLIQHPSDPDQLMAASWERRRSAWNFTESGDGSGIYGSSDGGDSWILLSDEESGFPTGDGVGRIGLSMYAQDDKVLTYAILDNYDRRPAEDEDISDDLSKDDLRDMSIDDFLVYDSDKIDSYLRSNRFPEKYTAATLIDLVKRGKLTLEQIASYTENANSLLFDTPVIGAEVYVSRDRGKTWTRTHEGYLDGLYNSYGYYFGQIRVDPRDSEEIYVLGVPVLRSDDGGASWSNINGDNVHADHHALWINPDRDGHIILGNDGGVNISYDHGKNWIKCNSPSLGQFYSVHVDDAEPYHVYGGLQDNGVWAGSHKYRPGTRWHGSGDYPYDFLMGGDGMQVQVDPRDNATVYTGFQFGNYFRIHKGTNERTYITPMHELGQSPYRWNWQTPIHLSVHNPDILYMGAQSVLRSMDRGNNFTKISDDLTGGGIKGDVPYGTLTSIHESPLKFGLIYVGSDDGHIHRTDDGGATWIKISDDLPQDLWVTTVEASAHEEDRVYATLNGYRWDHMQTYIYRSDDRGKTWENISRGIKQEPVNVIREDPEHADILYTGTDHGAYVSLDRGASWSSMVGSMPHVAVHDIAIQSREKDIVLGTHGRSFLLGDLQGIYLMATSDALALHIPTEISQNANWGSQRNVYSPVSRDSMTITVYNPSAGTAELTIKSTLDDKNALVYRKNVDLHKGLTILHYDMTAQPPLQQKFSKKSKSDDSTAYRQGKDGNFYLQPGSYVMEISLAGTSASQTFTLN